MIKLFIFSFFISCLSLQCKAQSNHSENVKIVGGPCEGCEAIFEKEFQNLQNKDSLPGYSENTPQLELSGTVYKSDGKTPAENIVVYIYHTDQNGVYYSEPGAKGWEKRHGMYRGWIKTNRDGKYAFYTFEPAAYPERNVPIHIHFTVKEPGYREYYIDEVIFNDDPLLTTIEKNDRPNRGGSGLVYPEKVDGKILIQRDIILGYNIPDYE